MEQRKFYRPGLDALRFFAFISVFIHHTPFSNGSWYAYTEAFGFGMQTFFLLSAYLITELLLREKEKTGAIHFRAFYIRRILRIWPLYFLGVFIAVVASRLYPQYWLGKARLLGYVFFFVNFVGRGNTPMANLWSISLEEQFYLVWPTIIWLHRRMLIPVISTLFVPMAFAVLTSKSYLGTDLWYNTFVEFMFFGVGASLALLLHRRTIRFSVQTCALLFAAGMSLWFSTALLGGRASKVPSHLCAVYMLAGIGCVLIFFAFLAFPEQLYSKRILYLGTISYGLYVYHYPILTVVLPRFLEHATSNAVVQAAVIDVIGFCLTLAIAACSYHLFETPFLKLKARFTFVPSKAVSSKAPDRIADELSETEHTSQTESLLRLLEAIVWQGARVRKNVESPETESASAELTDRL